MRVSVCMATFNGESHITQQLSSILNQEFINNSNVELEVIISDDNSTDQTLQLINNFNDGRIKIVTHTPKKYTSYNSLISATKNFENAIKHSTGDFIFLSDQDDIWYSNKIDTMLSALEKKSCCICSFDWIDQFGNDIGTTVYNNKIKSPLNLVLRFPYYGFCFGFSNKYKAYILPIPTIPQHDLFIGFIAYLKNDLVVLPDVLCAHRKFINTTENNTSDSGFKENLITKLYYRIKLIFIAILRSFK
jgi:glycosyltransferase involved in cell wall biosynthesis